MRIKILTILLCISSIVYGQQDSSHTNQKILLKWTPTALIGYSAIQIAGEVFYHSNKSVQLEYGFMLPDNDKTKGHKIRFEQRNYFGSKMFFYYTPEINFLFATFNTTQRFSQNWVTDSISGDKYALDSYFDTVGIKKTKVGANFKIGFQYVFKKPKLSLDVYLGLGVQYIMTKFTSYPTVGENVPPKDAFWDDYNRKEGNRFAPNGIVGIKIGYQIN